jgi:deoxycytidylate deaminase
MNIIIFYAAGYNKYETTLNHGTIHAEIDALLKLPQQSKPKKISLCVFTTNKEGSILRMSKCCENCEKSIYILSKKKNYIIKKVYYIDEDGQLQTM